MRIFSRISLLRASESHVEALRDAGLAGAREGEAYDVEVSSEVYRVATEVLGLDHGPHLPSFDQADCRTARWLRLLARVQGYPMPSGDFDYRKRLFGVEKPSCCTMFDKEQVESYRLSKKTISTSLDIFGLNWDSDAIFCKADTYEDVFKQFGIPTLRVFNHANNEVEPHILQLLPQARVHLDLNSRSRTDCKVCGHPRYQVGPNWFPEPIDVPEGVDLVASHEYIGSAGFNAFRPLIVSNRLYRAITDHKLKRAFFAPTASRIK